jgi:signal transduction histidine kinase
METIISGNEWKGEFHNRRKNGDLYWEKANIIPIKNNKGQIMNFLAIKEDITETRKPQPALVESEALLKEAVDTKDKFFSMVSHDLRGPISSMVSLTELMTDPAYSFTPDEIHSYTASLHHTADSTYRLLENLLEWSRLQRGTIPFMPELIDVSGLLNTCDLSLTEKARNKHIDLKMNYQEGLTLVADENMLRSVIRNLLSNAIKFTKPGGEIHIEVNKIENNEIIFIIKDNGIGMPQKILDGIFKVAENVSRPGTNNEPSSGLGLILCKEFIEKHGGRIWGESEEGKGSAFYFVLPVEHTTTVVI